VKFRCGNVPSVANLFFLGSFFLIKVAEYQNCAAVAKLMVYETVISASTLRVVELHLTGNLQYLGFNWQIL